MLSGVVAMGYSPTSLNFKVDIGEQRCDMIIIDSESSVVRVSDQWAYDKDIDWSVGKFEEDASYHSISLKYDDELFVTERDVKVCIRGNKPGEYHGVILFEEEYEESSNSVSRYGVWIDLYVKGEGESIKGGTQLATTTSGGASGTTGDNVATENISEEKNGVVIRDLSKTEGGEEKIAELEKREEEKMDYESMITGGVIGVNDGGRISLVVGFIIVVGLVGLIVYSKRN